MIKVIPSAGFLLSVGSLSLAGSFYPHGHKIVAAPLGRNKRGRLTRKRSILFRKGREAQLGDLHMHLMGHLSPRTARESGKPRILELCACLCV